MKKLPKFLNRIIDIEDDFRLESSSKEDYIELSSTKEYFSSNNSLKEDFSSEKSLSSIHISSLLSFELDSKSSSKQENTSYKENDLFRKQVVETKKRNYRTLLK